MLESGNGWERPTAVVPLDAGPVEYRFEERGDRTVVVFHGGHMRAALAVGEDEFAAAGYTVLVPSRPGYGRTPRSTGITATGFADVTAALCDRLGVRTIDVVGISAGGRTAVAMAARHPGLVSRLILQSAVGPLPWPDRRTRVAAHAVFAPGRERVTWAGMRALFRTAPDLGLRTLLGDLTTRPAGDVIAALSGADRDWLTGLFTHMRSGSGFVNDLRATADVTAEVEQPTLVIATRDDGSVPFAHAEALAAGIRDAELIESRAATHLIWLGPDWPAIAARMLPS